MIIGVFNSGYNDLSDWLLDEDPKDIMAERHDKSPITYQQSAIDPIGYLFASPSLCI